MPRVRRAALTDAEAIAAILVETTAVREVHGGTAVVAERVRAVLAVEDSTANVAVAEVDGADESHKLAVMRRSNSLA